MRKNGWLVAAVGLMALVGLVACGGGGGDSGGGGGVFDKYDCDTSATSDAAESSDAASDATSEMDASCLETICGLKTGYENMDNAGCNTNSATKKICAAQQKCITDYVACIEEKCPSFTECGTAYDTCVQAASQSALSK